MAYTPEYQASEFGDVIIDVLGTYLVTFKDYIPLLVVLGIAAVALMGVKRLLPFGIMR